MRLRLRALSLLSLLLAVGCLAESGGHCLNPQPDLPCGSADTASKGGSGPSNSGSGAELPPALGSGGASANAGTPSLDISGSSQAGGGAGGSSNGSAGAAEAGSGGDAAGAAGEAGDRQFPLVR